MKQQFTFLGLQTPERRKYAKAIMIQSKTLPILDLFSLIDSYYKKLEREYHYIAIDIAIENMKRLSLEDILKLADYVPQKSWWDSVDAWRKLFGLRIRYFPNEREEIFYHFYNHENFWMRRIGINLQLLEREKTDLMLLSKAIINDIKTDEFFIQKAIGWSLREYSKTDSKWVSNFIKKHELSPLAKREASKYL